VLASRHAGGWHADKLGSYGVDQCAIPAALRSAQVQPDIYLVEPQISGQTAQMCIQRYKLTSTTEQSTSEPRHEWCLPRQAGRSLSNRTCKLDTGYHTRHTALCRPLMSLEPVAVLCNGPRYSGVLTGLRRWYISTMENNANADPPPHEMRASARGYANLRKPAIG
jgi:hypothetical protein